MLRLIAGLLRRVVGVLDVRVGARPVGMLDEDVQVVLTVHQDLILNHSSFLQVLQLLERHIVIV